MKNMVYETDPSGRDPCHLTLAISCRKNVNYEFRSLQMMANQIGPVDWDAFDWSTAKQAAFHRRLRIQGLEIAFLSE